MPPVIDKNKCVNCSVCVQICPTDVLHTKAGSELPEIRYPEECWHCNACVLDCPVKAVTLRIPLPAMLLYTESPKKQI
ncbi:MAG TPA: ferredoxin family protein [Negativicutes bacterium]|jgi:adenylylsulfate reductase subunit B